MRNSSSPDHLPEPPLFVCCQTDSVFLPPHDHLTPTPFAYPQGGILFGFHVLTDNTSLAEYQDLPSVRKFGRIKLLGWEAYRRHHALYVEFRPASRIWRDNPLIIGSATTGNSDDGGQEQRSRARVRGHGRGGRHHYSFARVDSLPVDRVALPRRGRLLSSGKSPMWARSSPESGAHSRQRNTLAEHVRDLLDIPGRARIDGGPIAGIGDQGVADPIARRSATGLPCQRGSPLGG